jgi:hypothetical protein
MLHLQTREQGIPLFVTLLSNKVTYPWGPDRRSEHIVGFCGSTKTVPNSVEGGCYTDPFRTIRLSPKMRQYCIEACIIEVGRHVARRHL